MSVEPERTARPESQTDPATIKKEVETLDGTFPPEATDLMRQLNLEMPTVDHPEAMVPPETPASPPDATGTITASPTQAQRSAELSGWATSTPELPVFPGYELLEELGRGGMGVVYKARDEQLGRVVALKVLQGDKADGKSLSRFLVEAKAVAAVKHGHVVEVHHYGEHCGCPYMILDYCPGGTLADRLRTGPRLTPGEAAALIQKIALGVAAAHAKGIVHRDLKPGNVLFDEAGEPKVADFGLAKLTAGADLTMVGDVMGTPAYMAPEQASGAGNTAGARYDVWALGVILYQSLSGTRPFDGNSTQEILAAVQSQEPVPLRHGVHATPRDLEFVCHKCLRKDPAGRYSDASELAAELRRFMDGESLSGRRREWGYRAKKVLVRWRHWIGIAAILIACFITLWKIARSDSTSTQPLVVEEDPAVTLRRAEVVRRAELLSRTKPLPDRIPPHPVNKVPQLTRPDYSGFQLVYDDRLVDLRGWRRLPQNDPTAECFVINNGRQVWTKLAEAQTLRIDGKTTGRDLVMRSLSPKPDSVRIVVTESTEFVGGQAMKVRQLVHDVSDVPVGSDFVVQHRSTFWNSLQEDNEQWFGVIGYEGSKLTSMLLLYPEDRPFREFQLRVAATRNEPPSPYTGPVVTFQAVDRRWLYWEIPNPVAGHVYRVDWTW